jgi:hypothetical protein
MHAREMASLMAVHWSRTSIRHLEGFNDVFPDLPSANSLQAATLEVVREPGVYIIEGPMGYIEGPMGYGKTEAALAASFNLLAVEKAGGFYFALPTQGPATAFICECSRL